MFMGLAYHFNMYTRSKHRPIVTSFKLTNYIIYIIMTYELNYLQCSVRILKLSEMIRSSCTSLLVNAVAHTQHAIINPFKFICSEWTVGMDTLRKLVMYRL